MCEAPDGPYSLAIGLPADPGHPLSLPAGSVTGCAAVVGTGNGYGSLQTGALTPYTPNSNSPFANQPSTALNDLGFLILGQQQLKAHAGAVLTYQLTVGNSQLHPSSVSLTPCLGYREILNDATSNKVVASELHLLNCAAQPTLPPNSTVEFDMEIAIPASVPIGTQLNLSWYSALGTQAYGSPTITVD